MAGPLPNGNAMGSGWFARAFRACQMAAGPRERASNDGRADRLLILSTRDAHRVRCSDVGADWPAKRRIRGVFCSSDIDDSLVLGHDADGSAGGLTR